VTHLLLYRTFIHDSFLSLSFPLEYWETIAENILKKEYLICIRNIFLEVFGFIYWCSYFRLRVVIRMFRLHLFVLKYIRYRPKVKKQIKNFELYLQKLIRIKCVWKCRCYRLKRDYSHIKIE
jgi:hypothetical protein